MSNEKYYIHLRTSGTILPWQYYAFDFKVSENFEEFILPIENFKKSGSFLFSQIKPKNIKVSKNLSNNLFLPKGLNLTKDIKISTKL